MCLAAELVTSIRRLLDRKIALLPLNNLEEGVTRGFGQATHNTKIQGSCINVQQPNSRCALSYDSLHHNRVRWAELGLSRLRIIKLSQKMSCICDTEPLRTPCHSSKHLQVVMRWQPPGIRRCGFRRVHPSVPAPLVAPHKAAPSS